MYESKEPNKEPQPQKKNNMKLRVRRVTVRRLEQAEPARVGRNEDGADTWWPC